MLCTSGFVDDVIFAHRTDQNMLATLFAYEQSQRRWTNLKVTGNDIYRLRWKVLIIITIIMMLIVELCALLEERERERERENNTQFLKYHMSTSRIANAGINSCKREMLLLLTTHGKWYMVTEQRYCRCKWVWMVFEVIYLLQTLLSAISRLVAQKFTSFQHHRVSRSPSTAIKRLICHFVHDARGMRDNVAAVIRGTFFTCQYA